MTLFNNIISYRHLEMLRTVFCTAFLTLFTMMMVCSVTPAWAQHAVQEVISENLNDGIEGVEADIVISNPYIISDINVDITADNAVKAREQAFEAAQIKGYQMLAKRLLSEEALKEFKTPDINTVAMLVQDYEVSDEKLSATRYKGTYQIRYSQHAFAQHNAQAMGLQRKIQGESLILPFYEANGQATLWQENPFMTAWRKALSNNMQYHFILPVGDIEDLSQIRDGQALSYNPVDLRAMQARYQAQNIVILQAIPEIIRDKVQKVSVSMYRAESYGPKLSRQIVVQVYAGEVQEQFYNRVVAEVRKELQLMEKRQRDLHNPRRNIAFNPLPSRNMGDAFVAPLTGEAKIISAEVNFNAVREWIKIKKSLEYVAGIKSVRVKSLSPRKAIVDLAIQSDMTRLQDALQYAGLGLKKINVDPDNVGKTATYMIYSVRASGRSISRNLDPSEKNIYE